MLPLVLVALAHPLAAQPALPDWLGDVLEERATRADERDDREEREERRQRDSDRGSPSQLRERALDWRGEPGEPRLDARSAARRAREAYGGRVLGVKRKGDSYRVRLLLDEGRVTTVTIRE
ncbi:MAG: hypothetical protein RIC38_10150 [Chromatocurvus sp.]